MIAISIIGSLLIVISYFCGYWIGIERYKYQYSQAYLPQLYYDANGKPYKVYEQVGFICAKSGSKL